MIPKSGFLLYYLMLIKSEPSLYEKLALLANGAKFDVSCASSGVERKSSSAKIGSTSRFGICHSWSSDGRCISLLKVLLTNYCINDCAYCINRKRNDINRTILLPEELAKLTYEFYRRNYIEGLFLSSGIIGNPEKTMEMMIDTVKILRQKYGFHGYVHLKIIPDTSEQTIREAIKWADRVSMNIELPNENSMRLLAPDKKFSKILKSIGRISQLLRDSRDKNEGFNSKGGQSTQIIIGATPDTDYEILRLSYHLYRKNRLKRVYYSGYIPVNQDSRLPALATPPLLREHRLYQADWLLRFYGFSLDEIVNEKNQNLEQNLDPKMSWALRNPYFFPIDISSASLEVLLRVPGIGPVSARRIIKHRRYSNLGLRELSKLGVVTKRAKYFITWKGKPLSEKVFPENSLNFVETSTSIEETQLRISL